MAINKKKLLIIGPWTLILLIAAELFFLMAQGLWKLFF